MSGNVGQKQVYIWWSADGINMIPVTLSNPLPVQGTVSATNPSVGVNGAVAPTSSTEIGIVDGSGNLQGVSSSNPVPVSLPGNVTVVQPTGTNLHTVVDSGTVTANLKPVTSGGLTPYSDSIDPTTNATLVKNSPGQIYGIEIFNNSTNIAYLKLYDSSTIPTAGVGTPVARLMVPGNTTGAGVVRSYENGMNFSNGIAYTFVSGIADNDATAVAGSEFLVNLYYV